MPDLVHGKGGLFIFHYRMFLTRHKGGTDRQKKLAAGGMGALKGIRKLSHLLKVTPTTGRSLQADLLLSNQHTTTNMLTQEETSSY
jgi:hypothetical protein